MKLCVPTLGHGGLEEQVSPHFGRAPTFTLVDLETQDVRVLPNVSEHMGGLGTPPEHLVKERVQVMLCSNLGPRAVDMFQNFGIEVYVGAEGSVREAIQLWKKGMLQQATDENACKEARHRLW